MAKKSSINRNDKRKKLASLQATKRKELKAKAVDYSISDEDRAEARKKLQALPRNGAKNRVKSRCAVTGRSKAVYKKFGLCRNKFRELALEGKIPGVTKASW